MELKLGSLYVFLLIMSTIEINYCVHKILALDPVTSNIFRKKYGTGNEYTQGNLVLRHNIFYSFKLTDQVPCTQKAISDSSSLL
jgi:hypothetical protein